MAPESLRRWVLQAECIVLGATRARFYAWKRRLASPSELRHRQLSELIHRVFADSRET